MRIYDLTPFSMQDFPDRLAAILWIGGCNLRCPYCHNPDIVYGKNEFGFEEVLEFLRRRKGRLDGVVFSGGEPTLHPGLLEMASSIKELGYAIKLDTNGTRPGVLQELLEKGVLDYVAMDIKAPPQKYKRVAGRDLFDEVKSSLDILIESGIKFELRTTVHTDLLGEADIEAIAKLLQEADYKGIYYIQNFVDSGKTLRTLPPQKRLLKPLELPVRSAYRNF